MIHTPIRRTALLLAIGGTGLALLSGCSSASPDDATAKAKESPGGVSTSVAPTKAQKATASLASLATAECTDASILASLPAGSTVVKYECAIASPTIWAAVQVKGDPAVFFLQAESGAWKVSKIDQVCVTPSKGIPKAIVAYCPRT